MSTTSGVTSTTRPIRIMPGRIFLFARLCSNISLKLSLMLSLACLLGTRTVGRRHIPAPRGFVHDWVRRPCLALLGSFLPPQSPRQSRMPYAPDYIADRRPGGIHDGGSRGCDQQRDRAVCIPPVTRG